MLKYGPHVSRDNFVEGISEYPCCQLYLAGNMGRKWKKLEVPELPPDSCFFIHCPLNINMGFDGENYMSGVITNCCNEVDGVAGSCVLHIGKCKGRKRDQCRDMSEGSVARKYLQTIADRINQIKLVSSNNPKTLLLENAAGRNGELGNRWNDIRLLFEALDDTSKIGLCLDTQHSFSSGLCSFENEEKVNKWLDKAQEITKVGCIHLNDSEVVYKGYNDAHESLGKGYIWKENKDSLEALLVRCYVDDIPLICETNTFKSDNKLVQKLIDNYNLL